MKRKWNDENRNLCKTCNIWITNNKAQRDQHEAGSKHKTAQAKLIKDIAAKNELRRKEELSAAKVHASNNLPQHGAAHKLLEHAMKSAERIHYQPSIPSNSLHPSNETVIANNTVPAKTTDSTTFKTDIISSGIEEESTEQDEYPLPANEVLGPWETVEENQPKDSTGEVLGTSKDENTHSNKQTEMEGYLKENSYVAGKGKDTPEEQPEASESSKFFGVSFKRKMPSLSKRKKRKTR